MDRIAHASANKTLSQLAANPQLNSPDRRSLLRAGMLSAGAVATYGMAGCATPNPSLRSTGGVDNLCGLIDVGPLQDADENGIRLPSGFTSKIVATTDQEVLKADSSGTGYTWHLDPDGGACYPTPDGGWIYVSNSEETPGGVGAIRFDKDANITDAYSICENTRNNCAGGYTPWGTWITCEEADGGYAIECDPNGVFDPVVLPAMGRYRHEAVAIDDLNGVAYLTEDIGDGGFYRTIPTSYPDFRTGELFILEVIEGDPTLGPVLVRWNKIDDPNAGITEQCDPFSGAQCLINEGNPTRSQANYTAFKGGEGCWHYEGLIFFATKGDKRVWVYNTDNETVESIYDFNDGVGVLEGPDDAISPDNVTVSANGDIMISEDGAQERLVIVTPDGRAKVFLEVMHSGSELCGPAFSPDGQKLYFSSQRGDNANGDGKGITFEISGAFC
jgi:hypothetical protein